jgi:hypothetical protein
MVAMERSIGTAMKGLRDPFPFCLTYFVVLFRSKLRTKALEIGAHNIKPSIHALTTVLLKQLNTEKSRIKSALGKEPLDRSEGDIDFVSKWLYAHESSKVQDLFRSIPETTLRQTCREMRYLKVTGNSVVISEGSICIYLFLPL